MRIFVAVMADELIKQLAQQLIKELSGLPHTENIAWINLKKLHLTLQFLGDVNAEQLAYMLEQLPLALSGLIHFTIEPCAIALFPYTERPSVMALRFKPSAELENLANRVKKVALEAGIALNSSSFQSHLSLGRLKKRPYPWINDIIISGERSFTIKQVTLLESKLQNNGSLYLPIQRFSLD